MSVLHLQMNAAPANIRKGNGRFVQQLVHAHLENAARCTKGWSGEAAARHPIVKWKSALDRSCIFVVRKLARFGNACPQFRSADNVLNARELVTTFFR